MVRIKKWPNGCSNSMPFWGRHMERHEMVDPLPLACYQKLRQTELGWALVLESPAVKILPRWQPPPRSKPKMANFGYKMANSRSQRGPDRLKWSIGPQSRYH